MDASQHTGVKDPSKPFNFSFPDLNGQIVSNTDARFQGKVVLINITGSWCPNCHDEAPFLAAHKQRYGQSTGIGWNNATAPVPQRSSIIGNICVGNYQDGIDINLSNVSAQYSYLTVSGNYCENNGETSPYGTGINVQFASLAVISNNICFGNGLDGIRMYSGAECAVNGNICIANGSVTPGTVYNGISLESATNCTLHGNICTNQSGGFNQFYGIREDAGCNGNVISGNNCTNNVSGTTLVQGATSVLRDDVGGYLDQSFTLNITNNAGTLQHSIYGQSGAQALGNYSSRVNNASAGATNTPTGPDSSTPMAAGGKISSVTSNNFIFDVAPQIVGYTDIEAVVEFNSTGNAITVRPQVISQNVNGVTQYRLNLSFSNATTGTAFTLNTTSIPGSDTIQVRVKGRLF